MNTAFYFIPLYIALISWLASCFTLLLLFYPRKGVLQRNTLPLFKSFAANLAQDFSLKEWLANELNKETLKEEIKAILDKRLNILVDSLKATLPLGEMFLTKTLTDSLKKQAKDELMKVLPELPDVLSKRISLEGTLDQLIEEKLNLESISSDNPALKKLKRDLIWVTVYAAFAGFVVGLVVVAVVNL